MADYTKREIRKEQMAEYVRRRPEQHEMPRCAFGTAATIAVHLRDKTLYFCDAHAAEADL